MSKNFNNTSSTDINAIKTTHSQLFSEEFKLKPFVGDTFGQRNLRNTTDLQIRQLKFFIPKM